MRYCNQTWYIASLYIKNPVGIAYGPHGVKVNVTLLKIENYFWTIARAWNEIL
jgi:hypothetical protein